MSTLVIRPTKSYLRPDKDWRRMVVGRKESAGGSTLLSGLAFHWKLDEASGQRNDSVGILHLTDNNTVTGGTGPVGIGNASTFLAANSEYLNHLDNPILDMGDFSCTWGIWVNPKATGFHTIMQKDAGGDRGFVLYHDATNDKFHWVVFDTGGGNVNITSTGVFAESSGWHFILCGYDKPNTRAFMSVDNGADDVAAMTNPPRANALEFTLGRLDVPIGIDYFTGDLASAGRWDRLLTGGEKTSLYAAGAGLPYPF